MAAGKVRSFIAIDIDDDAVLARLLGAQEILKATGADLKLVEPENIHVTIRFLGEIEQSMVNKVIGGMNGIRFQPFEAELVGLGAFPDLKRINVVWVGIRKGAEEMANIFGQLEAQLRKVGIPADPKGFLPHVTIARTKSGRNKEALSRAIQSLAEESFGTIRAERLELKKSVLTPKGPIYSTIYVKTAEA